jgi:hypothetical protein
MLSGFNGLYGIGMARVIWSEAGGAKGITQPPGGRARCA